MLFWIFEFPIMIRLTRGTKLFWSQQWVDRSIISRHLAKPSAMIWLSIASDWVENNSGIMTNWFSCMVKSSFITFQYYSQNAMVISYIGLLVLSYLSRTSHTINLGIPCSLSTQSFWAKTHMAFQQGAFTDIYFTAM